ncbi:hypothetical protein MMC11_005167 [Xylographa trunciseda]|nr:hypothetical protein [Xylographa trunciseda]
MTSNSELVDHFKVDAQVTPTHTLHEKIISDPAEGVRGSIKKEVWQVVRPIGHGTFGQVLLQKGDRGQLRAVKSIVRRRHGESKDLDLSRELLAMASFAKDNPYFNIFVASKAPNWWVKIGDFGISKRVHNGETALRTMMTGDYVAPESIAPDLWAMLYGDDNADQDYTNAVDIWSLGCVTYWLLTFSNPFPSGMGLFQYCSAKTGFPFGALQSAKVNSECVSFLQKVMAPLPWERLTASQALMSRWLRALSTIPIPAETHRPRPNISVSLKSPISPQATSSQRDRISLGPYSLHHYLLNQYSALKKVESELLARLSKPRTPVQPRPAYPYSTAYPFSLSSPYTPYMPPYPMSPYYSNTVNTGLYSTQYLNPPYHPRTTPASNSQDLPHRPSYGNVPPDMVSSNLSSPPSSSSPLTPPPPPTNPSTVFQIPKRTSASIIIKTPDGRTIFVPKKTEAESTSGIDVVKTTLGPLNIDDNHVKAKNLPVPRKLTEDRKQKEKGMRAFQNSFRLPKFQMPESSSNADAVIESPVVGSVQGLEISRATEKLPPKPDDLTAHDNAEHVYSPLLSPQNSMDLHENTSEISRIRVKIPTFTHSTIPRARVKLPPSTRDTPTDTNEQEPYASDVVEPSSEDGWTEVKRGGRKRQPR